jgi:hypothetical protein
MPVLGEAANNPEIVLRHLFRSDLLRRFYYRWLLPIEGALSDNWLSRWHLNHVFMVKRGLGDRWRSRSDLVDLLSLRLDMSRLLPIKFALSGRGRNGYCPFQLYDLAIDKSVIGRAQLDNYGATMPASGK